MYPYAERIKHFEKLKDEELIEINHRKMINEEFNDCLKNLIYYDYMLKRIREKRRADNARRRKNGLQAN